VQRASVVGLVATGTEPVPERGHRAGIQPAHRGVVVVRGDTIGLGPAVPRRHCPVNDVARLGTHAVEST
jgi:hypothetical protein